MAANYIGPTRKTMSHNGNGTSNGVGTTITDGEARPRKNAEAMPTNEAITREPFPASEKIFVSGSQPGVQVPMREISLRPTRLIDGSSEDNGSIRVYDTSGPYTDPSIAIDVRK